VAVSCDSPKDDKLSVQ